MQGQNPWPGFENQPPSHPNLVNNQPQSIPIGQPMQQGFVTNPVMMIPTTSAATALWVSILSIFCGGICLAIPALLIANSALNITKQYPGHPDAATAKTAQIISWVVIGLTILSILFYVGLIALMAGSAESSGSF